VETTKNVDQHTLKGHRRTGQLLLLVSSCGNLKGTDLSETLYSRNYKNLGGGGEITTKVCNKIQIRKFRLVENSPSYLQF